MRVPLQGRREPGYGGVIRQSRWQEGVGKEKKSNSAWLSPIAIGLLLFGTFVVAGPLQAAAAPAFVTTSGSHFVYQGQNIVLRGENFNNEPALACCGGPDINTVNDVQADYVKVHQLGANVLRWGIDYNWYASNRTQFYSVLDQHMAWAAQNQLWVFLVAFIPPGGSSGGFDQSASAGYCIWSDCANSGANQTAFNAMWQDVATHYANNTTIVGYDVMNEPAPPSDSEWTNLATRVYNTITAADSNHFVIIEAPLSNDLSGFQITSRVSYSVHHYPGGDNFPTGQPANTPMIVGEFGDQRTSSSAVTFVTNEIARYNSMGVSWTHFVFHEDSAGFGLYVDPAGDFSNPWPAMISAVTAGEAGNAMPAPSGSAPAPSPTPTPTSTPTPTATPSPPPSSGGVPVYDHVVQILMENHSYNEVIGQPYIASLAKTGAIAGNYFAVDHPSLPNYLALSSAQDPSFASSDCAPAPGCNLSSANLADRFEAAGKTWKSYSESMGTTCRQDGDSLYDVNHNPWVYYTNISGNATRCNSHVVDYSALAGDLASTSTTPNYMFIDPNLQNDMHDGTIAQGDTWLSQHVPAILNSPAFTQQHSLLIIEWDEDDGSQNNQVGFVAVGYNVKVNYISNVSYDHYSMVKTLETMWSMPTLTTNDGSASAMTDLFGSSTPPPPPPALTASSSASATSGAAPLAVNFTGSASGGTTPYTYAWNFGDGTSSTAQNPSHSYSAAGSYTATLRVTDAASATANATAIPITVSGQLSATVHAAPSVGDAPLAVTLTGSGAGGAPPYTYAWTFGDGATATTQNAGHTYSAAGTYTATLTVTDAAAQAASASAIIVVSPALSATASGTPTSGDAPLTVAFTGGSAGGLAPAAFSWNFGDGTTSTTQSPSHTYTSAGNFLARLTVTDGNAVTAIATVSITVAPGLTAAASGSPTTGDAPLAVAFTGSTTGGTAPLTYSWTFGDGTTSTSQGPSHSYSAAGTYTAQFTAHDAVGRTANATVTVIVNPALQASASASPTAGDAPLAVTFTGSSTGGTAPFTYSWAFGDGGTSTGLSPTHTYNAAGSYTAIFTVTDGTGHTASSSAPVTVSPALSASATASPTSGNVPLTVNFTGTASGGAAPFTYSWTFGDGTTSTGQNPSHTYTLAGTYHPALTVTDSFGNHATVSTATLNISGPLVASAHGQPLAGDAPVTVSFTGSATGGTAPYTYSWAFGDASTASPQQNPAHIYAAAGTYTAILTVTDAAAATSTSSVTVVVSPALTATSSATPSSGDASLPVAFTGSAGGGLAPYAYSWAFGDGTTSTSPSPSHTYSAPGTYSAVLTVTDANLAHATATALTIIVRPAPSVAAAATPSATDAPAAVSFTATVTGGTSPFTYAWSFGDGGSETAQNPTHTYGAAGSYTATVTITDAIGRTASGSVTVSLNTPPAVSAQASVTTGDAPLAVGFAATATGGTSPFTYAWSFGDGTTSSAQNPTHTYAVGTFSAQVTVTDAAGHTAAAAPVTITVSPTLVATSSAAPTGGDAPLAVTFTGSAAGGAGPFTYSWSFGDGSTSTAQNPNHTYTTVGTYTAVLTVSDANHGSALATGLTIATHAAPSATAAATPAAGDAPVTVSFTATVSGGSSPFTYSWSFGDGGAATTASPSHTYNAVGSYTANVTITDADGRTASASTTVTVSPPPTASAAASATGGDAPLAVSFTGTATGGTGPYTYAWNFGDGTTSTAQNPSHTYAAGTFSAQLTLTDVAGQTAAATPLTITVLPGLSITAAESSVAGVVPLTVSFTSTATGGLAPYTYLWDFGDGSTSTTGNANHTYSATGTYAPALSVTDANGVTKTAPAGTVTVNGPLAASAAASPTVGDAPATIKLTGTPSGGVGPYTYAWAFGDGTSTTVASPTHVFSTAGVFSPTLTVTDSQGHTAQASTQLTIYTKLNVTSTVSPTSGAAPLAVTLTGSATGGLAPYSYAWSFGDGATGAGAVATHTYNGGSFSVSLTVHDAAGGTWTGAVAIVTSAAPPPPASGNSGSVSAPPAAAVAPPAAESPSPSPSASPSSSPSAEASPSAGAAAANQPSSGGGSGGVPALLLLGSLFGTGIGGAVFLAWRRRRLGPL